RSAASRPSVTSVLPEPERGAAMTMPLAKGVAPQRRAVPVEQFAIGTDRTDDDERRRFEPAQPARRAEGRFDDLLFGQGRVTDDGDPVGGRTPGRDEAVGDGAKVLDRH